VGDNISSFRSGDLVLIGSNLPHHWHSDSEYRQNGSTLSVEAIVIKFGEDPGGIRMFDLPENETIRQLLQRAVRGLLITGELQKRVIAEMNILLAADGVRRLICLLTILESLAEAKGLIPLSTEDYQAHEKGSHTDRMNKVYDYMINNYLVKVSLDKAAELANMNTTAFCKYFKKRYGKTFIRMVNEIRVGYACRQLQLPDSTVSEVCFKSGFGDLSNFTKIFKKITGVSPKKYQQKTRTN
jgi:AraC-like DNA-binding protein